MKLTNVVPADAGKVTLAAALDDAASIMAAKLAQEFNLPDTIKRMHRVGWLTFDDVTAIKRLVSDLNRVTARGDIVRLGYDDFLPHQETGAEPPLSIDCDPHHYALHKLDNLVNGVDPSLIRAPNYTTAPYHQGKLIRATAPGRLVTARRAVDVAVKPGACRMLCHTALGMSYS